MMAQNYVNSAKIQPQKSVNHWSKPETPEQVAYFSTHAPKRQIYGIVQTAIQLLWAVVSFVACKNLFDKAFDHTPALMWLSNYFAVFALVVLHVLLRTTYQTYWYDKMDDRTETDSSILLPALIMAALVWLDYEGAKSFFKSQVEPPVYQSTVSIDSIYQSTLARHNTDYEKRKGEIDEIFERKATAAALPYDQQIKRLEHTKPVNGDDRRFIATKLNKLRRQRDEASAPILAAKADSIQSAFAAHQARLGRLEQNKDSALQKVDQHNTGEENRHQTDLSEVGNYAWYLSCFFMLIFAMLGYAIVRINVKSGILPVREYTDLDQHGSAFSKIGLAISDGAKRQLHRFAVWLHELLTQDARNLPDFDGRVFVTGTPDQKPPKTPTPTLPTDSTKAKPPFVEIITNGSQHHHINNDVPGKQ